jgi:GT2 family glycosyltransferase
MALKQFDFGIIIPTLNRSELIKEVIIDFNNYSALHQKSMSIVVVESGDISLHDALNQYTNDYFKISVKYSPVKSSAYQRTSGLKELPKCKYVIFTDDDIRFTDGCISEFISKADLLNNDNPSCAGFAPLLTGLYIKNPFGFFSSTIYKFFYKADFYGNFFSPGINIGPKISTVPYGVNWFMSGFMMFRYEVLQNIEFDPFFMGYSVFEDVDFSYRLNKSGINLTILPIIFEHREAGYETRDWKAISEQSIINRYYVGKKHFSNDRLFRIKFALFIFLLIIIPFLVHFKKYRIHLKGILKGIHKIVFTSDIIYAGKG